MMRLLRAKTVSRTTRRSRQQRGAPDHITNVQRLGRASRGAARWCLHGFDLAILPDGKQKGLERHGTTRNYE